MKKEKFLEKLRKIFPDKYEEVISYIQKPKRISFRVNTLKSSEQEVLDSLTAQGFQFGNGPVPGSYILIESPHRLSETEEFKEGKLYIQSLSSMLPVLALDPKPGENILDMCAAPGSKTTHMAQITRNQSYITAVENNRNRFFALQKNLELQGVEGVKLELENAKLLDKIHPELLERFDKILLDAPCSNEGNICLSDPKTYESWNPKSAKKLSKLQKGLLNTAFRLVKPGGQVVYSTCTFSVEENEGVIEWFRKKHPEIKVLSQERITPDVNFTGFFVAKLEKPAS